MKLSDSLIIQSNALLSYEEIKSLSLLYTPIIESDGVTTFLLFASLLNPATLVSDKLQVSFYKTLLALSIKEFETVLDKLSACGLIDLFESQTEDGLWLVVLNKPVDAERFKDALLLRNNFVAKLNLKNAQTVFDSFKLSPVKTKDFRLVSKEFSDIFPYLVPVEIKVKSTYRGTKKERLPEVNNYFDYHLFLEKLPPELIGENNLLLDSEDYTKEIQMIAFTNELSEAELAQVYIKAYEHYNTPTTKDLAYFARVYRGESETNEASSGMDINEEIFTTTPISKIIKAYASSKNLTVTPLDTQNANSFYLEHKEKNKVYLAVAVLKSLAKLNEVPNINYLNKVLDNLLKNYHKPQELLADFLLQQKHSNTSKPTYNNKQSKHSRLKRHAWLDDVIRDIASDDGE